MDLSVVIPCRNGLPWLTEQLDALARQQPGVEWEVVVADNGSTDGSPAVAQSYANRLPIRVIDASDRPGPAHARNVGVAATMGVALVFLDQDDVIALGYLEAMLAAMGDHPLLMATTECDSLNPGWIDAPGGPGTAERAGGPICGAALGMRRSLFDRLGGLDEDIGVGDDVDIIRRAERDAGIPLHSVPDAILHYRYRTKLADILRQGFVYGQAYVLLDQRWSPGASDHVAARVWLGVGRRLLTARTAGERRSAVFVLGRTIGLAKARRRARSSERA